MFTPPNLELHYIIVALTKNFLASVLRRGQHKLLTGPFLAGSVLHHYETELHRLRSEYAGLSGTKRKELEGLLMEGDLLEVTLDEVYQIWTVLHQDTVTLTAFERSGSEDGEGEKGKPEEGRRRRKRKGASLVTSASSSEGPSVSAGKGVKVPTQKRQKRMARSTTPKSSPSPAPSNSSSHSE